MPDLPPRIKKLQEMLSYWKVNGLLVTDPIDLLYLTSLEMTAGKLFVSKEKAVFVVDGRYLEKCKRHSTIPTFLDTQENLFDLLTKKDLKTITQLGFDSNATSYKQFEQLQTFFQTVQGKKIRLVPLANPLHELRMIKDSSEQQKIKAACTLVSRSLEHIIPRLKAGITEEEIAKTLQIFWLQHGGDGAAFDPIIAFGKNSAMPHYRHGKVPLKEGDIVLIDIGAMVDHYCSDMTRVFFYKKAPPKLQEIAHIVQKAQEAAIAQCKPKVTTRQLDTIARDVITKAGYGEYFVHGLGHGLGLEIHESPYLKKELSYPDVPLQAGMVITIEPGIYIPDLGGVRIEDTILVKELGCENLIPLSRAPIVL